MQICKLCAGFWIIVIGVAILAYAILEAKGQLPSFIGGTPSA